MMYFLLSTTNTALFLEKNIFFQQFEQRPPPIKTPLWKKENKKI